MQCAINVFCLCCCLTAIRILSLLFLFLAFVLTPLAVSTLWSVGQVNTMICVGIRSFGSAPLSCLASTPRTELLFNDAL
jgi:hypothetical protein